MKEGMGATFVFNKERISAIRLEKIKEELTFNSTDGSKMGYGKSKTIELFHEHQNLISVPRLYAKKRLISLFPLKDVGGIKFEHHADLQFNSKGVDDWINKDKSTMDDKKAMHEKQKTALEEFQIELNKCRPLPEGVLIAPAGSGKTVMGMMLMAELRKKTLILVHKDFLSEQWIEGMKRLLFLNGKLIQDSDIGICQQKKCDFEGKKIVIGMVQSIAKSNYPDEFWNHFGLILADEVHRYASPVWVKAIGRISAPIRIGLTATLRRGDGLTGIFKWTIGHKLAEIKGYQLKPDVYQISCPVDIQPNRYRSKHKIFFGMLSSLIAEDYEMRRCILEQLEPAAKAGRKIMVLSDRVAALEFLKIQFDNLFLNVTSSLYTGKVKKEDRKKAEDADVIFCTIQMMKEGLDIPELDTCFITTVHSDVEQMIGRILRIHEGKKKPLVVDIVPELPECLERAIKRVYLYERLGFCIKRKIEIEKSAKDNI